MIFRYSMPCCCCNDKIYIANENAQKSDSFSGWLTRVIARSFGALSGLESLAICSFHCIAGQIPLNLSMQWCIKSILYDNVNYSVFTSQYPELVDPPVIIDDPAIRRETIELKTGVIPVLDAVLLLQKKWKLTMNRLESRDRLLWEKTCSGCGCTVRFCAVCFRAEWGAGRSHRQRSKT